MHTAILAERAGSYGAPHRGRHDPPYARRRVTPGAARTRARRCATPAGVRRRQLQGARLCTSGVVLAATQGPEDRAHAGHKQERLVQAGAKRHRRPSESSSAAPLSPRGRGPRSCASAWNRGRCEIAGTKRPELEFRALLGGNGLESVDLRRAQRTGARCEPRVLLPINSPLMSRSAVRVRSAALVFYANLQAKRKLSSTITSP